MHFLEFRLVLALLWTTTFTPGVAAGHAGPRLNRPRAPRRSRMRLPADYTQWSRVAACESGGWRVLGYAYPDSLGIDRANFTAFGGKPLPPGPVSRLNKIMQVQVANRLIAHYHTAVPDRYGCAAW